MNLYILKNLDFLFYNIFIIYFHIFLIEQIKKYNN